MTASLLRAPHDIRRDRKRSAKYIETHKLLAGFVARQRLDRECEQALEEALFNEDSQRTAGLVL